MHHVVNYYIVVPLPLKVIHDLYFNILIKPYLKQVSLWVWSEYQYYTPSILIKKVVLDKFESNIRNINHK